MFSSMRNFLYRHRRKFMWVGVTVGGAVVASKFAEYKLREWQETTTREAIEQQRRKQHYERTLDTTRVSLHQLLPNIRKTLELELDSELFIRAIKENPGRKREYWEQLKLVGFGRALCTALCPALVASASHVLMTVLAAHTLDGNTPFEVQTSFLSCLQGLVEDQLPKLVEKIMAVANPVVGNIPLTRKLTMAQLEVILQDISVSLVNDREVSEGQSRVSILPWSRYLPEPEPILECPEYNEQLRSMYLMAVDVFNTDDFNDVVGTLVQVGVSYVLDEMAGFYFATAFSDQEETAQVQKDVEETKVVELKTDDNSSTDAVVSDENKIPEVKNISDSVSTCAAPPTCVIAKLVPALSSILHTALPNTSTVPHSQVSSQYHGYLHRIIACSQLEALAFGVYDSLVLTA